MARILAVTCTLTAWSGLSDVNFHIEAHDSDDDFTKFENSGWCFGSDDYYVGDTHSAKVHTVNAHANNVQHTDPAHLFYPPAFAEHFCIALG